MEKIKGYYQKVFSEIGVTYDKKWDVRQYNWHTNKNIPNANWTWFQTYNSIIHGATGVIFYMLGGDYNNEDIADNARASELSKSNIQQCQNYNNFVFTNDSYFYQNYLSNLAKELRYLKEKNLLLIILLLLSVIYSYDNTANASPNAKPTLISKVVNSPKHISNPCQSNTGGSGTPISTLYSNLTNAQTALNSSKVILNIWKDNVSSRATDSLIAFVGQQNNLVDKFELATIYYNLGQYTNMESVFTDISNMDLNDIQTADYTNFVSIMNIAKTAKEDGLLSDFLSETQITNMETILNSKRANVSSLA